MDKLIGILKNSNSYNDFELFFKSIKEQDINDRRLLFEVLVKKYSVDGIELFSKIFTMEFGYEKKLFHYEEINYKSKVRCIDSTDIIETDYFIDFLFVIIEKYNLNVSTDDVYNLNKSFEDIESLILCNEDSDIFTVISTNFYEGELIPRS